MTFPSEYSLGFTANSEQLCLSSAFEKDGQLPLQLLPIKQNDWEDGSSPVYFLCTY